MKNSLRLVSCGGAIAAAFALASPAQAALTRADRLGTPLMVPVPAVATASAGSSTVVAPGEVALVDRSVPDRTAVIYQGDGPQWMNVDWGDTVLFTVRQPGVPDRIVKWRFNGLDNVVSFADIDPQAQFANNVRIYVNQNVSPLHPDNAG